MCYGQQRLPNWRMPFAELPTPPRLPRLGGRIAVALFEQLEIGDDLGRLVVCKSQVGHQRTRLLRGRIQNPRLEIVRTVVGYRAASDLGPTGDPCQIRPN